MVEILKRRNYGTTEKHFSFFPIHYFELLYYLTLVLKVITKTLAFKKTYFVLKYFFCYLV